MDAFLLPDEFKVASVHEFISESHFANHISLQLRRSKPILDINGVVVYSLYVVLWIRINAHSSLSKKPSDRVHPRTTLAAIT